MCDDVGRCLLWQTELSDQDELPTATPEVADPHDT